MNNREEIEQIRRILDKVEVVSFDVFDTLLLRNVINPTDIFVAVEKKYFDKHGKKIEFKKNRILAEKEARKCSKNEDVTFEEIYKKLNKIFLEETQELKRLEIELEKKFLVCNTRMLEIYNYAISQGKRVIIISDMYLDKDSINKLLYINNYRGPHTLYVSSDTMKSKATGTLYNYIKDEEYILESSKWLHIGDNYQADYINAKKNNINAYYYKAVKERYTKYKCDNLTESIIRAMQINTMYLEDEKNYWYTFGQDKAIPMYVGFMIWLEKELEGKDNVYFLARDGYIPSTLYQIMRRKNTKLPVGKYIYASRRSYIYANLFNLDQDEALDVLLAANSNLGQKITLKEIFNNIGLNSEKYIEELKRRGIDDLEKYIEKSDLVKNIRCFLKDIWKDIEEVSKREYALLEEYLRQEGLYDSKEINIIDIGWRGSTHRILQQMLNKQVNGYYLGTIMQIYDEIKGNSKGYLFNEGNPNKNKNIVIENVMIFEFLFSAPMGSVIKFETKNNKVEPILAEVEKNNYMYDINQQIIAASKELFEKIYEYRNYLEVDRYNMGLDVIKKFLDDKCIIDLMQFKKLTNSIGFGMSKDVKAYVLEVEEEELIKNFNKIINKGTEMLWKDGFLIKDRYERYFNLKEYCSLNKIKLIKKHLLAKKVINTVKKCILNPKKAIKYVLRKILKL